MARTGCASVAAICACATAQKRRRARQALPAYGLQDSPPIHFQECTKVLLRTTPGGHFNMAENRTFLLCVDSGSEEKEISAIWKRGSRSETRRAKLEKRRGRQDQVIVPESFHPGEARRARNLATRPDAPESGAEEKIGSLPLPPAAGRRDDIRRAVSRGWSEERPTPRLGAKGGRG